MPHLLEPYSINCPDMYCLYDQFWVETSTRHGNFVIKMGNPEKGIFIEHQWHCMHLINQVAVASWDDGFNIPAGRPSNKIWWDFYEGTFFKSQHF